MTLDIVSNCYTTINLNKFSPGSHENTSSYLGKNTVYYFDWI